MESPLWMLPKADHLGGDDLTFVDTTVSTFSIRIKFAIRAFHNANQLDFHVVAKTQDVGWAGEDF